MNPALAEDLIIDDHENEYMFDGNNDSDNGVGVVIGVSAVNGVHNGVVDSDKAGSYSNNVTNGDYGMEEWKEVDDDSDNNESDDDE